jgi:hypothetical protein
MGWSLGYDDKWRRDIGYGVPAVCDHPKCDKRIDRGLAYVCGGEPYGGEKGCGLHFCGEHLSFAHGPQRCPKCNRYDKTPYRPKPDMKGWSLWKLRHESWQTWRDENPGEVAELVRQLP